MNITYYKGEIKPPLIKLSKKYKGGTRTPLELTKLGCLPVPDDPC